MIRCENVIKSCDVVIELDNKIKPKKEFKTAA